MPSTFESRTSKYLAQPVSRRKVVKAAGIAALGLVFVKPTIETLRPPPVYGQVSGGTQRDTTPPEHAWRPVDRPETFGIQVHDAESGMCSITDNGSVNTIISIPAFASGTTSPVLVTAQKRGEGPATLQLRISDCAGNSTDCEYDLPHRKDVDGEGARGERRSRASRLRYRY